MTSFLTVKEASARTGRSLSSVHRFIHPIVRDDRHPDRPLIEPAPEQARELRVRGEKFAWRISEELLSREFARQEEAPNTTQSRPQSKGEKQSLQELIALLREQLQLNQTQLAVKDQQMASKDQQIASLSEITSSLNDRLHEGNVLIATLQRQLALPEATSKPATPQAATKSTSKLAGPGKQQAGKKVESKAGKSAPKTQPKKGFFARLFS